MSLTREQWVELWKDAKQLELYVGIAHPSKAARIRATKLVDKLKENIQSVIGQME